MTTSRTLTASLALALAVTLGACSEDAEGPDTTGIEVTGPEESPDQSPGAGSETSAGESGDEGSEAVGSALAAIAAAEAEVGGTAFEIESEDGGWDVDVAISDTRYVEVRVDRDGTVVRVDDEDDLDSTDREGLAAATISLGEAIEIAFAETGGVVDDVELDRQGGALVWEVNLDDGPDREYDVDVDVATGEVVSVDVDD